MKEEFSVNLILIRIAWTTLKFFKSIGRKRYDFIYLRADLFQLFYQISYMHDIPLTLFHEEIP
jgi:hypothetical protein